MNTYQHKKGNRITKFALLNLITDIMRRHQVEKRRWVDEGFDKENDMIHFSSDGHKCVLLAVGYPNLETCAIPLVVKTEWDGDPNAWVEVEVEMQFLHINTLEKIACEVYNALWDPEKDDDYDLVRDKFVASHLDSYLTL